MLENIIDVDGASLLATALSDSTPGALYTDFGTAFPSLYVQWACLALFAMGAPVWFINDVYYIYSNGIATVVLGGQQFPSFRSSSAAASDKVALAPLSFSGSPLTPS